MAWRSGSAVLSEPTSTAAPAEAASAPPSAPAKTEGSTNPVTTGKAQTKRPTAETFRKAFMTPSEPAEAAPEAPPKVEEPKAKTEEPKAKSDDDNEIRDRQRRDMRVTDLDERENRVAELEKKIAERERSSDLHKLRDKYVENRAEGVKELLKAWGVADDSDMRDEAEDLALEIVESILGVQVDAGRKSAALNRKTQKALKLWKSDQAKRDAEAAERSSIEQHATALRNAAHTIQDQLGLGENVKKYPWLSSESDAGALVVERWKKYNDKDGTNKHWTDVAAELDKKFENQGLSWYQSRKHLLSTSEPKQDAPADAPRTTAAPGPQVKQAETSKAIPKPGKWYGAEAKRKDTMAKIRQMLKEQPK